MYALVARGKTVLTEYTQVLGNFQTVTRILLGKIPQESAKMSYVYDSYTFHYMIQKGLTYMVMADKDFGRRVPFAFIDEVSRQYST